MADNQDSRASERADVPSQSADGASAANTELSSVLTDLTVSDFNLLEQEALDDTPGVFGALPFLGMHGPPEAALGLCLNARNRYAAAAGTGQAFAGTSTVIRTGLNENRCAASKPKYTFAPTPESSDEDLRYRRYRRTAEWDESSDSDDDNELTYEENEAQEDREQIDQGVQVEDGRPVEHDENDASEDKPEEQTEKLGKRFLEATLQLQEKIAKLETYERIHDIMTPIPEQDPSFPIAGVLSHAGNPPVLAPAGFGIPSDKLEDTIRALKEEKKFLERQKHLSDLLYREMEAKFNRVVIDLNKITLETKGEVLELKSSLRFKDFELERMGLLLTELEDNLKIGKNENVALKKQIESMRAQMIDVEYELERNIASVNIQLQSASAKLLVYEQLEDCLDDIIVSAAQGAENDFPVVFEGAASLLTDSKRRIQQSFEMAKKVYNLEAVVREQKGEILQLYDERQSLRCEVDTLKAAQSKPVSKLVYTISEKSSEIEKLTQRLSTMEKEYISMKAAKDAMEKSVESTKRSADQMLELYKIASSLTTSASRDDDLAVPENDAYRFLHGKSREQITTQSVPIVPKTPKRITFEGVENTESVRELQMNKDPIQRKSKSPSGSYLSIQKSISPKNPSAPVPASPDDDTRPVALTLSKVKPTDSTQF